jgi:hypothetical protein
VAAATADFETFSATKVPAEPPLRCYVTASCPATVRLQVSASPSRETAGRTMTLHLTVRVRIDGISQAVPGAAVTLGQFSGRADEHGRAVLRVRFRAKGEWTVIARARRFLSGRSRVQVSAARSRGNRR